MTNSALCSPKRQDIFSKQHQTMYAWHTQLQDHHSRSWKTAKRSKSKLGSWHRCYSSSNPEGECTWFSPDPRQNFQASLDTGKLVSDWKNVNVSPIFKKGDKTKASNYWPVSLTLSVLQGPWACITFANHEISRSVYKLRKKTWASGGFPCQ